MKRIAWKRNVDKGCAVVRKKEARKGETLVMRDDEDDGEMMR